MKLRAALATASLVFASTLVTTAYSPDVSAAGIQGEWKVSKKKAEKRNPIPPGPHSQEQGQTIYDRDCFHCHGHGLAPQTTDGAPNLASWPVLAQSDGTLFWKIKTGKNKMPGFHKLSNEDIWHVVNYMRSDLSD